MKIFKRNGVCLIFLLSLVFYTTTLGSVLADGKHKGSHDTRLTKSTRHGVNSLVEITKLVGNFLMTIVFEIWGLIRSICNNCLPPPPPLPTLQPLPPGLPGIAGVPDIIKVVVDFLVNFLPQIGNLIGTFIPIPGVGLIISNVIGFVTNVLPSALGTLVDFLNGLFHLNLPGVKSVGDVLSFIIDVVNHIITVGLNAFIGFFNTFIGPLLKVTIPHNPTDNPLEIFYGVFSTLVVEIIQAVVSFINPLLNSAIHITLPLPDDGPQNLIPVINHLAAPIIQAIIQILFNFFDSTIGAIIKFKLPPLPPKIQEPIQVVLESVNIVISKILHVLIDLFNVNLGKLIHLKVPDDVNIIDNPLAIINNVFQWLLSNILRGIIQFFSNIGKILPLPYIDIDPHKIVQNIETAASGFLSQILKIIIHFIDIFTSGIGINIPDYGNSTDNLGILINATSAVGTAIFDIITGTKPETDPTEGTPAGNCTQTSTTSSTKKPTENSNSTETLGSSITTDENATEIGKISTKFIGNSKHTTPGKPQTSTNEKARNRI